MVHTYMLGIGETEAGGERVLATLGHRERPCLKETKSTTQAETSLR